MICASQLDLWDWERGSPFRSAPAQKARPSPVMIPARNDGSLSSQVHKDSNSAWPSELIQFRSLGRDNTTRRTCGLGNDIFVKAVDGGLVAKLGDAIGVLGSGLKLRSSLIHN